MSNVLIRVHPNHLVYRSPQEAKRMVDANQAVYCGSSGRPTAAPKAKATSTAPKPKDKPKTKKRKGGSR